MHDRLFARQPPIDLPWLVELARALGLDVDRFVADLENPEVIARVEQDLRDGRKNGVTGTPTLFVDGIRYDGAWDFHSMLESLQQPIAVRMQRSARAFASLPASAGLVLVVAAALALVCANSPLAGLYQSLMETHVGVGPVGSLLSLPVREWFSEGLLTFFFLLVGLGIRREFTRGSLTQWKAAILPVVAATGGVVVPAVIYLGLNRGPTSTGWAIPTATDIAFTLGLMAVLGDRVPTILRVFVAALAIVDDILSVLTLAIFYPREFVPSYWVAVLGALAVLVALNRARVYATWPYVAATFALWLSLHSLGVHAALAGVLLAMCIPTRPAPSAGPLLAQAATALAALEQAEKDSERAGESLEGRPVWQWASLNLAAASERLMSPADRVERALTSWAAFVILPAFAFSATGVAITTHFTFPEARWVFLGVVLGLVVGKPVGILAASALAVGTRLAIPPRGVSIVQLIGAACLCGVGDTMAILLADRALPPDEAPVAKLAVLCGSLIAGVLGMIVLLLGARTRAPAESAPRSSQPWPGT